MKAFETQGPSEKTFWNYRITVSDHSCTHGWKRGSIARAKVIPKISKADITSIPYSSERIYVTPMFIAVFIAIAKT